MTLIETSNILVRLEVTKTIQNDLSRDLGGPTLKNNIHFP